MNPDRTIRVYREAVAIVTGGASGTGRALSEQLVKRGCEVVIVDLQGGPAEEFAARLRLAGGKATAVEADVTDFSAIDQTVRSTVQRANRLDFMFNNAGIGIMGNVTHFDIKDWNYILNVNLNGIINGVQAACKVMVPQGFGHIVNTASMAGLMPYPGGVAYATTKHAVVGLSTSLRAEAAGLGIRVSVLCPGLIRTPMLQGGGKFGRMLIELSSETLTRIWESRKPMSPEVFAERSLDAVARNKAIIIEPPRWKRLWWLNRLAPSYGLALAQRNFQIDMKVFGS